MNRLFGETHFLHTAKAAKREFTNQLEPRGLIGRQSEFVHAIARKLNRSGVEHFGNSKWAALDLAVWVTIGSGLLFTLVNANRSIDRV